VQNLLVQTNSLDNQFFAVCKTKAEKNGKKLCTLSIKKKGFMDREVETGESDIDSNVNKLLNTGLEVLFVCEGKLLADIT